jgi:hypothetical protein
MKRLLVVIAAVAIVAGGLFVYKAGWFSRGVAPTKPVTGAAETAFGAPAASVPGGGAAAPQATQPAGAFPAAELPEGNLASADVGATIEFATSEYNWLGASRLLVKNETGRWSSKALAPDHTFPLDIVVSFFARQPALVGSVRVNPAGRLSMARSTKDVEVWTSMDGPTSGFTKVASATLRNEDVEQPIAFDPVEARYVKLRILSNYGDQQFVECAKFKVIEAQRPGYVSILARNPNLAALVSGASPGGPAPPAGASPAPAPALPALGCTAQSPAEQLPAPGRAESRNVLVILGRPDNYPPTGYTSSDTIGKIDYSIYGRLKFTTVTPENASPVLLLPAVGVDTVVLAQVCDIKTSVSDAFKKALIPWIAAGHKLIIQDADTCSGASVPDYSFLPYPFATSNPGALGAKGTALAFVEENFIANAKADDPGYLDLESWLKNTNGNNNEIGDSNTIKAYDPHWCGHVFGTNALRINGFMEAYAHYGRGLIIYDGFDKDQRASPAYRQLLTRELTQGFDPDNLSCSARFGAFVITTDQRLKSQPMIPGRSFVYPLTLLSNQGYKGTVRLAMGSAAADPTIKYQFEPDTIDLSEISKATLTVTTTKDASASSRTLEVRGADPNGQSNVLCLNLYERRSGGIQVVNGLQRAKKPTKNLEIILDASGSMKLPLGTKTRWTTALDVLKQVLDKLPDDFNVGLRIYGHRQPSTSPKTCTDSELVLPIQKLDRAAVMAAANRVKPRGETPLVYSVLQSPGDLKAVGAGTVIVITDGEESCGGDPKAAVTKLAASGVDVTLNIVGFTLTGKNVESQLSAFSEAAGGHFYSAQNGERLARALLTATVEKFPYTILDASGKTVAKGEAGAPPEELPAGDYTVVVRAGDQELKAGPLTVVRGADIVLKVVLKADQFAIERF